MKNDNFYEIKFDSWEKFEDEHLGYFDIKKESFNSGSFSTLLFRGHKCSSWNLRSSLHRYLQKEEVTVGEYDRLINALKGHVNSLLGTKYEALSRYPDYKKLSELHQIVSHDIEFKTFLRHFGFPSPLLDWTRSIHIAAYFAFNEQSSEEHVAIFAFREFNGGGKVWSSGENKIETIGPYLHTDKRHYLQQAEYSVCFGKNTDDQLVYKNYDWLFENESRDLSQDVMYKFLIPATERIKVLKKLMTVNVNSYSLFQTPDSLLSSLAFNELIINKRL